MAGNMMEMLRQIHQDQRESTRYLHDKLNFMERKIIELDKKIDEQQVPIKRLEELVRKNNMLLFGNDEIGTEIEDQNAVSYPDHEEKADYTVKPFMDNVKEKQPENDTKINSEQTSINLQSMEDGDQEFTCIKKENIDANTNAANEETAGTLSCKQDIEVSPAGLVANQIMELDEKLTRITEMYRSDMKEMNNIIKSFEATVVSLTEDQSNHLNLVLVQFTDMNRTELSGMKEFMTEFAEKIKQETIIQLKQVAQTQESELIDIKQLIKNIAMPVAEASTGQRTVIKISPTYFNADQISKLNSELKRIAETYKGSKMLPIIEVLPGSADKHPYIKHLEKGVYYEGIAGDVGKIKLGTGGLKRSDIIDMITDYPDLNFNEVVKEWLGTDVTWDNNFKPLDMESPKIYNKHGKLCPLRL